MRLRALLLVLLVGCAAADIAAQGAVGALMMADYEQTKSITRDGYEGNKLIGKHGERIPPAPYFIAAFVLHTVMSIALPRPWRNVWQGGVCIAQGVTVWNNHVDGYSVFEW